MENLTEMKFREQRRTGMTVSSRSVLRQLKIAG